MNDIDEWVKKEKYKISFNFKALCGYYWSKYIYTSSC